MVDTRAYPETPGSERNDDARLSRDDVHVQFTWLEADRGLAHNRTPVGEPVLASFDISTAAIWGNSALARAIRRHLQNRRKLGDHDVETLVHEFAHVLEYEDLFEEHGTQRARAAALSRRLAINVSRSTEESFLNRMLMYDHRAEELVRRVALEILSSFDRSQRGTGFREFEINRRAEGLADTWMDEHRGDYLQKARREHRRLTAARAGDENDESPFDALMRDARLEQVYVKSVARMFPTDQSPTLRQLIDRMIGYDMTLVVPLIDPAG